MVQFEHNLHYTKKTKHILNHEKARRMPLDNIKRRKKELHLDWGRIRYSGV